jgi:hypothetical protein
MTKQLFGDFVLGVKRSFNQIEAMNYIYMQKGIIE